MRSTMKWVPASAGWRQQRNHMLALLVGCVTGSLVSVYAYQTSYPRQGMYAFGALWMASLAVVCLVMAYECQRRMGEALKKEGGA